MHGEADKTVAYTGTFSDPLLGAVQNLGIWAAANGCQDTMAKDTSNSAYIR